MLRAPPVAVHISRPFPSAVTHREVVRPALVARKLVTVERTFFGQQGGQNRLADRFVCHIAYPQAKLAAFMAHNLETGWSVVGKRATTSLLVSPTAGRVIGLGWRSLFPPRSARVRRPRSAARTSAQGVRFRWRCPARAGAKCQGRLTFGSSELLVNLPLRL